MVTLWIIALVTAASLAALQRQSLQDAWILEPYRLQKQGKYYTLLTSGLIHADLGHLFFNMLTLYFFGSYLENMYEAGGVSGLMVAALFFSGIVIANLPSALRHTRRPGYRTLGASGGVEAVVFATILLDPMNNICLYFALCLPGFVVGLGYLAYSYWQARNGQSYVNHEAHLSGAIYGILWQTIMTPGAWVTIWESIVS